MLIDCNAYVGHWPFRKLQEPTLDGLLYRMNRFGVDRALVSNINGIFYKFPDFANRELYEALESETTCRERMIPFAVLNPVVPWWERALEEADREMGMKGIRLYPRYHEYELTDSRCVELVEAARDRGMVVAVPQRMVDPRQRSWMDTRRTVGFSELADLVRRVPDARYMMLDTRGNPGDEAREVLRESEVVFDSTRATGVPIRGLSGTSFQALTSAFGEDRIVFGTGTPFIDYCSPFIRAAVWEEAGEETMDKIFHGNARRLPEI